MFPLALPIGVAPALRLCCPVKLARPHRMQAGRRIMMWFGILGPLLVRDGDVVVEVPAARQQALLAALLLRAGRPVPADVLAEMVWDGMPPPGAQTTLRTHVLRLRRALGPGAGARVRTRRRAYLVEATPEEVDALRFARLAKEGGAAVRAGDWARAAATLAEALALWRGAPLADVVAESARREEVQSARTLRVSSRWERRDTLTTSSRSARCGDRRQSGLLQ
jgi:DNA-binding winged helix-turn-helix (wHTH) protein